MPECISDSQCMAYGYFSYVDGPMIIQVAAKERHRLAFQNIKSLVDESKGTLFAPGTGVYFEIQYGGDENQGLHSGIDWSTFVDCPNQYRYLWTQTDEWEDEICGLDSPSPSYYTIPRVKKPSSSKTECISYEACDTNQVLTGLLKKGDMDAFHRALEYFQRIKRGKYEIKKRGGSSSCLEEQWEYKTSYSYCPCGTTCHYYIDDQGNQCGGCSCDCSHKYCDVYNVKCYNCIQSQCGRHSACDSVEVLVTPPTIKSETEVDTTTAKNVDNQTLGPMIPVDEDGNLDEEQLKPVSGISGSIRNLYLFTPPKAYINVKTSSIEYAWNSNYNKYTLSGGFNQKTYSHQDNNLWKQIKNGYYIPLDAIPATNSQLVFNSKDMGYKIEVEVLSGYAYGNVTYNSNEANPKPITSSLLCEFEVKIPGCNRECCEEPCDNCEPEKDEYKCCRNSVYLKKHPGYYSNNCASDETQKGILYRQIDLNDPFPNRVAGTNWNTWIQNDLNKQKLQQSFNIGNLEYSVNLTPNLIKSIREYNDIESSKYTNWIDINDDGSSSFLKSGTEAGRVLGNNLKTTLTTNYYALGCGPSNSGPEGYRWCD